MSEQAPPDQSQQAQMEELRKNFMTFDEAQTAVLAISSALNERINNLRIMAIASATIFILLSGYLITESESGSLAPSYLKMSAGGAAVLYIASTILFGVSAIQTSTAKLNLHLWHSNKACDYWKVYPREQSRIELHGYFNITNNVSGISYAALALFVAASTLALFTLALVIS